MNKPITKQDHADMLDTLRAFEGRRMRVRYVPEGEAEPHTHEGVLTDVHSHERLGHPLFRIGGTLLAALNDRLVGIEPADEIRLEIMTTEEGARRLAELYAVGGLQSVASIPVKTVALDSIDSAVESWSGPNDRLLATPPPAKSGPRLTRAQSAQVRSLVEDSGYSKKDARAIVLAGGFVP